MNKIVVTTPHGSLDLADFVNVLNHAHEAITSKPVIVDSIFINEHFNFMPERQRQALVHEWTGTTLTAFLVSDISPETRERLKEIAYLTPDGDEKRAERDVLLWFPEHVIKNYVKL